MESDSQQMRQIAKVKDYQALFGSEMGLRVLWDLMENHNMLRPSFSRDSLEMAFNEGQRNVVLRILKMLKMNVEDLQNRIKEAGNE